MSLAVEAELYAPNRDDHATYVDYVPSQCVMKNGLKCVCGSRKEQIFYKPSSFKVHLKCQKHKDWLKMKNIAPQNDIKTIHELEKTIKNQQIIIHEKEREIVVLKNKIGMLESTKYVPVCDLLGIDDD